MNQIMGVNVVTNTAFIGLSYTSAMDALDAKQILTYTPLMNVNFPPNAYLYFTNFI